MAVGIRKHYFSVVRLSPLEGTAFAGANCRGERVSLAVNIKNNRIVFERRPSMKIFPLALIAATVLKIKAAA